MLPSTSAYTKFCDGTSQSRRAARNSSKFCARSMPSAARRMVEGSSAVQRRLTAIGVRHAPGDAGVVADDDRRQADEGKPDDVEAAGLGDGGAMQPVLVPDRRHA